MDEGLRAYMLKVYNYMATGILLTGIVALFNILKCLWLPMMLDQL